MEPEMVVREELLLAGVVATGGKVEDIDIHGLWKVYSESEPGIENRVDGCWYELHVGKTQGNGVYSVVAGAQIETVGGLPIEASLRVVPAGRYAHFVHYMKDGGFGEAFAGVEKWEKDSGTEVLNFGLQLYDRDFNPEDGNSALHIYIPLAPPA